MFNNRMLAVAAVLALAIPTLGAAAPIVAPPAYEQLVEGHTVFTVIEVFNNTTTVRAEFAAAVAVLVREYDAAQRQVRFPGVLWFNDQYLVNPVDVKERYANFRYPCGGAVMAVNAGDDDPRVILANVGSSGETRDAVTKYRPITGTGVDYGDNTNQDYTEYPPGPDPTPEDDTDDPTYAWANVTTDGSANSDTVVTSVADPDHIINDADDYTLDLFGEFNVAPDIFDYDESYLITDPNDHVWVIDKYVMYTRVGTSSSIDPATGTISPIVYARPVWVVNMLGSPVFIPDDGIASCGPYNDLVTSLYQNYGPARDPAYDNAAKNVDEAVGQVWDPTIGATLPYRDTPPAGYNEPSRNGYCYNGNPVYRDTNADGVADSCAAVAPTEPVRLYNALLYFKLADLDQPGTPRDHSVITSPTDTNGCQSGTEWRCPGTDLNGDGDINDPGEQDDNREGNSHPFHPTPGAGRNPPNPPHTDAGFPCPAGFYERDPLNPAGNHGGSTNYAAERGMYCGHDHATFNVDIYFSPAGRPFAPVYRNWGVLDVVGSAAPFHADSAADPHHST